MRKRMRNSEGCSFGLSSHNMQLALLCATHQVSEVQWQPYYMCHTLMHIKLFTSSVLRPSLSYRLSQKSPLITIFPRCDLASRRPVDITSLETFRVPEGKRSSV